LVLASPPPGGGRSAAKRPGGGDSRAANEAPKVRHRCHPTPDHLRWSDPPPSGEGEDDARPTNVMSPPKLDTFTPRVATQAGPVQRFRKTNHMLTDLQLVIPGSSTIGLRPTVSPRNDNHMIRTSKSLHQMLPDRPRRRPASRRLGSNSHGCRPIPAAAVTRPIIDNCDNVPHVGDRQRWHPVSKQVLPWRSKKLAAVIDPSRKRSVHGNSRACGIRRQLSRGRDCNSPAALLRAAGLPHLAAYAIRPTRFQAGRDALALARFNFWARFNFLVHPAGSRKYGGGSCNPSVLRSYFAPA